MFWLMIGHEESQEEPDVRPIRVEKSPFDNDYRAAVIYSLRLLC